ncbi:hypothetical protein [Burkholderia stabilis]|uniref:hypothetical protein n=1 Tax=Burkholderia stabilis TaxID=95485 RepID=UPI001FC8263C|nr:hypothetical protein [Burkholderia stabilis]
MPGALLRDCRVDLLVGVSLRLRVQGQRVRIDVGLAQPGGQIRRGAEQRRTTLRDATPYRTRDRGNRRRRIRARLGQLNFALHLEVGAGCIFVEGIDRHISASAWVS